MGGNPTQERTQGEIPEISAFRYTGVSEKAPLNPLNLNGLSFGATRRRLSDRLLQGVRFLVELAPRTSSEETASPEPKSEGLSVFQYHLPLQEYRAKRRQNTEFGRRLALAATVAVAVPALAFFAWKHLPSTPPADPKVPVVEAAAPQAPLVLAEAPKVSEAQPEAPKAPVSQAEAKKAAVPQTTAPKASFSWKQLPLISLAMPKDRVAPAEPPALATYKVKPGDSLYTVAKAHRVKLKALLAANNVKISYRLKIGQTLLIPTAAVPAEAPAVPTTTKPAVQEAKGTEPSARQEAPARIAADPVPTKVAEKPKAEPPVRAEKPKAEPARRTKRTKYTVQTGDTLTEIAERFGVKTAAIIEINDLDFHTTLRVGRKILIPANVESDDPGRGYRDKDKRKVASRGLVGDLARVVSKRFLWPTSGRVSSTFGFRSGRMHTGLDIPNHPGASIQAAKSGVVVSAGWDGDYGKTVDISHGKGVVTRYAHCSKLLVKPGERVSAGQTIALVGDTGRATGPHLHYEVRVNGRPVNPSKVM